MTAFVLEKASRIALKYYDSPLVSLECGFMVLINIKK